MAMSASRSINKNVSTSAISRAENIIISELVVNIINEADAAKKSFVWQYYGSLYRKSDAGTDLVDDGRLFCRYQ